MPTVHVEPLVAGTAPNWRQYTLPTGFQISYPIALLTVAPSDGDTAYMCQGGEPAKVLVTHDRGADWTRVADVAVGSVCNPLVVDDTNPNIVVAGSGQAMFLSMDDGESWQPFPGRSQIDSISDLAWSGSGVAYAMVAIQAGDGEDVHLAVSTDGLQTWRNIDSGVTVDASQGDVLSRFWRNAGNGALLVATSLHFWESNDGGQSWNRLTLPGTEAVDYVVQQPSGDADWRICSPFDCTVDGGKTWTPLSNFLPSAPGGGGDAESALAIASDGSLLVYGSGSTLGAFTIYRFPFGGSRWQDIGAIPAPPTVSAYYALYAPSPGTTGALWSLPPGGKGASSLYYSAALPTGG